MRGVDAIAAFARRGPLDAFDELAKRRRVVPRLQRRQARDGDAVPGQ